MRDLLLHHSIDPTLEERIADTRAVIRSYQFSRKILIGQRDLYPDEQSQATTFPRDLRNLGYVLMAEGRRLGGLVAAQRRQQ